MYRIKTRPPVRRAHSYKDPDLSDKWLDEAVWRAQNEHMWPMSARKIILRLVQEIKEINRETGR